MRGYCDNVVQLTSWRGTSSRSTQEQRKNGAGSEHRDTRPKFAAVSDPKNF